MAKISGIDNLDDKTEKRSQAYQQYYTYMQNNQPAQSTKTADSTSDESGGMSEQAEDSYQKSTTIATGTVYSSNGKRAIDLTAYTETKFVSESPPDVTTDMASQLFNSLDENKDHLLETNEYSKEASLNKNPPEEINSTPVSSS